jgi:uncharacterized membrane protein YqjE
MSTNGRARNDEPNVAASFSELTHDAIELAELQAQLFALDLKQTSQSTRISLMLAVAGVCVLLGATPVALMALAAFLVQQFGWSPAAGYGVAAMVGVAVSVAILAIAWSRFPTGIVTMRRSREELSRNIAWVKSSLRSRAQPNPTGKV